MAMADRMERAGKPELAEELRSCLAYVREAWRGSDADDTLYADLRTIADIAGRAAQIVGRYLDVLEP